MTLLGFLPEGLTNVIIQPNPYFVFIPEMLSPWSYLQVSKYCKTVSQRIKISLPFDEPSSDLSKPAQGTL